MTKELSCRDELDEETSIYSHGEWASSCPEPKYPVESQTYIHTYTYKCRDSQHKNHEIKIEYFIFPRDCDMWTVYVDEKKLGYTLL